MKKIVFFLIFAVILLAGCSKTEQQIGNRYIITSPEIAEIIYLLEGSDNIVGITVECDYPEQLKPIFKVGNFGNINYEKIISSNPTIVFTSGLEQQALAYQLNKLNIKTITIYPKNIDEFISAIIEIGAEINQLERAEFVADSLRTQINISTHFTGSPRVYVEIYGSPIMSVSDSSYVGQLVNFAGGENIFSTLPRDYSRINPENVIKADPEIILLTYPGITKEQVQQRKGWEVITAVKTGMIFTTVDIDPDIILRASPRITEGLSELKRIFHEK